MKAITICQPWAWAIAEGLKRYENRTWVTQHRGPLWIHAGKSRAWMREGLEFIRGLGFEVPDELPFGAVVARVEVIDCLRPAEVRPAGDPWAFGPWCHVYAEPRKLVKPVPCVGQMGLFNLPPEIEAECFAAEWTD